VREDAKKVLQDSVRAHLAACGWAAEGDQLVPLEGSVQEGVLTRADYETDRSRARTGSMRDQVEV
jgi:hypothetical protein